MVCFVFIEYRNAIRNCLELNVFTQRQLHSIIVVKFPIYYTASVPIQYTYIFTQCFLALRNHQPYVTSIFTMSLLCAALSLIYKACLFLWTENGQVLYSFYSLSQTAYLWSFANLFFSLNHLKKVSQIQYNLPTTVRRDTAHNKAEKTTEGVM